MKKRCKVPVYIMRLDHCVTTVIVNCDSFFDRKEILPNFVVNSETRSVIIYKIIIALIK